MLTLWADLYAREVTGPAMADAITLAQFYLSKAARLADAAVVSVETDRAERLRRWLLDAWREAEVLPSDVVQRAPIRALRESKAARAALGMLEAHGWLAPLPPGTVVRGRARREAWRIVRGTGDAL